MAVSNCLWQSFGVDYKHLLFLYLSAGEPIFTYGCSLWVSILRTKAGTKKFRSFQRSICRYITWAFKTATTESLILLSRYDGDEASNLALFALFGSFCHVFTISSAKSQGFVLARHLAQSRSPFLTFSVPSNHIIQIIRTKLWNVWSNEWSSLSTNSSAKAFFPAVWSTKALLNLRTMQQPPGSLLVTAS